MLKLSELKTVNNSGKQYCDTLDDLRDFVRSNFSTSLELPDLTLVEMGYIETGHGARGRKIWLCDDEDVQKMYYEHRNKKKIMLWCYTGLSSKSKDCV